ncbi:hypothetical protein [Candidatus Magnetominusculus dajiuhuensis]|uniref:hypothetical protein n=1 Tax=Candidatus Magnetominusculus dajiuhuensis TaxID=3137712 RepID=UPI003B4347C3
MSRFLIPKQGGLHIERILGAPLHISASFTDLYILIALSFCAEELISVYSHAGLIIPQ